MSTSFVIVIPTRRRLETLRWTLKTCLEQEYDNFQVIVLVNSCPATEEYLCGLADQRIISVPSQADLAMSDNWERLFEIEVDPSSYVFYLGDDDGLLPGALARADHLISTYRTDVLKWQKAEYCWPSIILPEYRNYASLRLGSEIEVRKTAPFLQAAHLFQTSYSCGPVIYSSFVRMSLLQQIREIAGNRFFRSCSPDVFSSYAIASFINSFVECLYPLSVNGASGQSNGIASIHKFFSDAAIHFRNTKEAHPTLVFAPSVIIGEADGLLTARDTLPQYFARYNFSFDTLVRRLGQEASQQTDPMRRELLVAAAVEIAVKNDVPPPEFSDNISPAASSPFPAPAYGFFPAAKKLSIDLGRVGVKDVYEACRVIAMLNPLEN